jgi:hypothetical protein
LVQYQYQHRALPPWVLLLTSCPFTR